LEIFSLTSGTFSSEIDNIQRQDPTPLNKAREDSLKAVQKKKEKKEEEYIWVPV
jgi:hypothetical protein